MYLRFTADEVELMAPEDVTALHALVPNGLSEAQVAAVVEQAGLGEVIPGGDHLLVEVQALRSLAQGRVPRTWEGQLAGMVKYARDRGWTDQDGQGVRVHVERR